MPYQNRMELLQGTLEMLILQILMWGPRHGYGIAQAIRAKSRELLQVDAGSLDRLCIGSKEKNGSARNGKSQENQRTKVYKVTAAGSRRLTQERRGGNRSLTRSQEC